MTNSKQQPTRLTLRPWLILGAGPTGLGAAWRLRERGETNVVILEAQQHSGGLASSFVDSQGFTWDLGSHLQFSHYDYYDRMLSQVLSDDDWITHRRSTWVYTEDAWVPYPFQQNLWRLPSESRWECVAGLLQAAPDQPSANFQQWQLNTFGAGITNCFLQPYNEKIWATDLTEMSADWVAERVAKPELAAVLKGVCLEQDQTNWGPNATFRYPRQGGTGSIWQRVQQQLPAEWFHFDCEVIAVDAASQTVTTRHKETFPYEALINTIPLDVFSELVTGAGDLSPARQLRHTVTQVIGFGFAGAVPTCLEGKCWVYLPESELPCYRATVMSHLSPHNVPDADQHWSLMLEIASSPDTAPPAETSWLPLLQQLKQRGLVPASALLLSVWQQPLPHGYPVPTLHRDDILGEILPRLEQYQILSRGRFGAWKYEVSNQDHSFMQGVEAVEHLLNDRPELTLQQPDLINARRNPFPYAEWRVTI